MNVFKASFWQKTFFSFVGWAKGAARAHLYYLLLQTTRMRTGSRASASGSRGWALAAARKAECLSWAGCGAGAGSASASDKLAADPGS